MEKVIKYKRRWLFCKTADTYPDVYVLMRMYCPPEADDSYYKKLKEAICSVKRNKDDYKGRVVLLINDDTKPAKDGGAGNHLTILKEYLKEFDFKEEDYIITKSQSNSSAYATYYIRKAFLRYSQKNAEQKNLDNIIAITLDQDDRLEDGAILNIADSMPARGIVVLPFSIVDSENLDITDDGGRRHNFLVRRLDYWPRRTRIAQKQQFIDRPKKQELWRAHGISEFWELLCRIFSIVDSRCRYWCSLCRNRLAGIKNIPDLSSIGWTKAYTRSVLQQYHDDLTRFLFEERNPEDKKKDREGIIRQYFTNHPAYEDFLDFYSLLLKDCHIAGVHKSTHAYLKHKQSITSSPKVEDFRNHRTAHLISLIDLCYKNKEKLRSDFEYKLLRFISTKVYQIDHIIAKYRNEFYEEGNNLYDEFAAQTHDGYFISKFCRLALGEDRGNDCKQDRDLFKYNTGRGKKSKDNIETLFSSEHISCVPEYQTIIKNTSVRFAVRKAVECEKRLAGCISPDNENEDEKEIKNLIGDALTPQEKFQWEILVIIAIWCLVFIVFVIAVLFCKWALKIEFSAELIAGIITAWVTILAAFFTEFFNVKKKASEEAALRKLYYSEFMDFIRHLEANLKVMIQVRKRIKESLDLQMIENVHFDNLRWPASSCLFKDDMSKIISRECVDDFSRLKVNIRNINNSARWLQSVSNDRGDDMLEDLEWEITRHIGLLVNMYYLKSHGFNSGSQNELDMFINENSIKNKLTDLFMDYSAKERNSEVEYFLTRYYDDRRMRRDVLVSD